MDAIEDNNMFSVRQTPWHNKGNVLLEPPTSEDAIKAAGMNWTVSKKKLWYSDGENPAEQPVHPVPDKFALVRSSDGKPLWVVSGSYVPLDNVDAFAFFDPLVKSGVAVYETAGVLHGGRRVWIQARLTKDVKIADDVCRPFVVLSNSFDCSTGVDLLDCLQRVVCWNTLCLAMSESGSRRASFMHRGDVKTSIEQAKAVLDLVVEDVRKMQEDGDRLADLKLSEGEILSLVNMMLDVGDDYGDDDVSPMRRKIRNTVMLLLKTGKGASDRTWNTGWGLYNAVAEFVDHFGGTLSSDRPAWVLYGGGRLMKDKMLSMLAAKAWGKTTVAVPAGVPSVSGGEPAAG